MTKKKKPEAVVYDVTGTLTRNSIANKARKDKAKGKKVLVLTSRPEDQRMETEEFLKKNKIPADKVVMRKKGDKRPDAKAKKDAYEKEIKGKYKVEKAYDDKPSNVKMLRKEGVKTKRVK